jgi:capsular exopolysaccharide synthesis family protein
MSDATTSNQRAPSGGTELSNILGRYKRHIPLVLLITFAVLIADAAFTWTRTPLYTGTATVYYAPVANDLLSRSASNQGADQARDQAVDTQVEVIKSPLVADDVITRLRLDRDPQFALKAGAKKLPPELQRDALIDNVEKYLKVKRVGQTLLISISFTSDSSTQSARIANAFSESFIMHDLTKKLSGSRGTNTLLNAQIDDMRQKVEAAENALQQYRAANGLLASGPQNDTMASQNLTLMNQQYAQARSDEALAKARLSAAENEIKAGRAGDDLGSSQESQTIGVLRGKKSDLSAKVADLQTRYGPMHPDLKNAQAELHDTDLQIQAEANRIMANLRAAVDAAHQKTLAVEQGLGQAKGQLMSGAISSVKMNELQRNADAARQLYENVLAKVKETSAQQAISQSDSHVDTPATPSSTPSSPNKPLNIALGLILGLGLGFGAAFLRESWNAQLTNLEDVEGMLGLPYLASIPTMTSAIEKPSTTSPADAVLAHPLSSFAEAFRGLAAALLHSQPGVRVRVIGITSALPGEGKTVTTVSLARVQAMSGQRVVLLDCDLRRRTANTMLIGEVDQGLIEFLEGNATLEQVIRIDEKSGAHFIPLSNSSHLAKAPFGNARFDALIEELKNRYDLIILDTPPLLPVVDTRILAQKVDALALLVKWRSTPLGAVKTAIHHLDTVGAPINGVVLSQVNMRSQAYSGYGYSGYYNKEFKRYYHQT